MALPPGEFWWSDLGRMRDSAQGVESLDRSDRTDREDAVKNSGSGGYSREVVAGERREGAQGGQQQFGALIEHVAFVRFERLDA